MNSSRHSVCTILSKVLLVTVIAVGSLPAAAQHYNRVDLTVDMTATSPSAPHQDANLVNPWGLSRSTGSFFWVSDNGMGVSTLYDGTGAAQPLVVTIPLPQGGSGKAAPTGTVFNFTKAFEVASGKPAVFLFVTEDGTISGWNPLANATKAIRKVDRSGSAVYKGVAIAQTSKGPMLFATNFQSGKIEAFDGTFHRVTLATGAFPAPSKQPNLVPFNVVNIGGKLLVTFAVRQKGEEDEQHGPGLGAAALYTTDGRLINHFQNGSWFNAPWGAVLAPGDFGFFAHRILIGNFGDGTIHAFDAFTGAHQGLMRLPNGSRLTIDGLWALSFGANARSASSLELYFTAGPNDEKNGIFGKITAVSIENKGNSE